MNGPKTYRGKRNLADLDGPASEYARSLIDRGVSRAKAYPAARKWRERHLLAMQYRIGKPSEELKTSIEKGGENYAKAMTKQFAEYEVLRSTPEDQAPAFEERNVALIASDFPEQLSADLYQVINGLRNTRYYKLDTPDRLYTMVGWYSRGNEIRISIIMRPTKQLTTDGQALASRYINR